LFVVAALSTGTYGARKVGKVRKFGRGATTIPRWIAVRQVRVRLFLTGIDPAFDGFHRGVIAVLAQIAIGFTGADQLDNDSFLIEPVAGDHPAHTERHRIERLIALAARRIAQLRDDAIKSDSGVSSTPKWLGLREERS
jgi:hypothetical protein